MKKYSSKIRTGVVVLIFAIAITLTTATVGASSDSDPLVTLSYINETVIPKITEEVKNAVLAILDEQKEETPTDPEASETPDATEPPEIADTPVEPEVPEVPVEPIVAEVDLSSVKYAVVHLEKGQKLFATGSNTESTEIILRAGEVISISPFGDQGIADLTASKELYNNDPLVKNNYCLIPRGSDGRGIYAANSDAYILVRGEYEIVQE
ncbi:MAG: hypothetical protein IKL05_04650 [Clostridia bacterium]|nr:hypothetical protein [Clostridia bacterium]